METIKVLGVYGKDYPESCQTILPKNLAMFGIDMEVKENIEETGIEEIKEKYSAVIMGLFAYHGEERIVKKLLDDNVKVGLYDTIHPSYDSDIGRSDEVKNLPFLDMPALAKNIAERIKQDVLKQNPTP